MEKITKDYRVDCSKSENILIREHLTKQGWVVVVESNISDREMKKPWQLWFEASSQQIWQADDNDFSGEQISAKEFIKRFGPEEETNEIKAGDLVEWAGSGDKGTGYLVGFKSKYDGDSLIEVVTCNVECEGGWERDCDVPKDYVSKATDKYYWIDDLKKIEEPKIQSVAGFKTGDKVRNKDTGVEDIVESVPGMEVYDLKGFCVPELGMCLENSSWARQEYWEKIDEASTQITDKNKPIFFKGESSQGEVDKMFGKNDLENLSAPDLFSKGLEEFDSCIKKEEDNSWFLSYPTDVSKLMWRSIGAS